MKKHILAIGLISGFLVSACSPEQINNATAGLKPDTNNSSTTTGGLNTTTPTSTGGTSNTTTATGSNTTTSPSTTATAPNAKFAEFVNDGDTYFGPAGNNADIDVKLAGNAGAGSRYGGPNDAVGVMVVVRNSRGFMEVVNLQNKNRFDVLDINGDPFSVPADTLGGKPFPSLFVIEITSLTSFKFDHRISPNPAVCNQYTATFTGTVSNGHYVAKRTTQGNCRF